MGWRCISNDCSVRIFSIAGEMSEIVKDVIEFIFSISPGIYIVLIFTIIAIFVVYMFIYIKRVITLEVA